MTAISCWIKHLDAKSEIIDHFVPQKIKNTCGSNYTILRSQFLEHRAAHIAKTPSGPGIKNVLVNFDFDNPDNITRRIIEIIRKSNTSTLML